jgi:hypothetical protein
MAKGAPPWAQFAGGLTLQAISQKGHTRYQRMVEVIRFFGPELRAL